MDKAKEISALWEQIKPQIGEMVRLCHEVEDHAEVTADAYQRGHKNGFIAGHLKAKKLGQSFYEDGYQKGLSDAWEAVRKIYNFDLEEREELFHDSERFNVGSICEAYSASEAIEKIRQYEQEQEEQIQVGDEVIVRDKTAVVTEITDRYVRIMFSGGNSYALFSKGVVKTGRHFPEIAEVLRKMKETDNG